MKLLSLLQDLILKYFRILVVFVCLVVVSLGYFLLLQDKIKNISVAGPSRIESLTKQRDSDRDYLDRLKESNKKFAEAYPPSALEELNNFLPNDARFPEVLLMIDNLVRSIGLRVNSLEVSRGGVAIPGSEDSLEQTDGAEPAPENTVAPIPQSVSDPNIVPIKPGSAPSNLAVAEISLSTSSGTTYEDFKRMVATFESSRRILNIMSLGFDLNASGGEDSSYNLVITTVYKNDPANPN